jgi:hypothetical protein
MNAQIQIEFLRLHCEQLRTLIDQLITEFTTIGYALARQDNPTYAAMAPHLQGLGEQSQHIAAETEHLQVLMRALKAKSKGATPKLLP